MINRIQTNAKEIKVVFQSALLTLAAAVCDQLERGGMPAELSTDRSGYVVVVPENYVSESCRLLVAQPHRGEIYFYQG
jgi:hypothetical protein